MKDKTLLKTGILGALVAALGCFTPALVVLLGAAGLSTLVPWADYVLWPAMFFFVGLAGFAFWQRRRRA